MKQRRNIESFMEDLPLPGLSPGEHKETLRQELMQAFNRKGNVMNARKLMKVAAVIAVVFMLVAGGLVAQQVAKPRKEQSTTYTVTSQSSTEVEQRLPGGGKLNYTVHRADTEVTSEAKLQLDNEIDSLIKARAYKFVKTYKGSRGDTQYAYTFKLKDGTNLGQSFAVKLDNVAGLADARRQSLSMITKLDDLKRERVTAAIAQGHYRLLDIDISPQYQVLDVRTGKTLCVQKVTTVLPVSQVQTAGMLTNTVRIEAVISDYPQYKAKTRTEMSWQAYQEEVAAGKLRVLKLDFILEQYKYEVTFDDGSTTEYTLGSFNRTAPLPDPKAATQPAAATEPVGHAPPTEHVAQ